MAKNREIENLIDVNRRLARLMFWHIQAALQGEKDYTLASMAIFKVLDERGPLSQHQIAQELCHSDAAVSRQINLLLAKEEVIVRHDSRNRKRSIVELSEKGRDAVRGVRTRVEAYFKEALQELSEEEVASMVQTNERLLAVLSNWQSKEHK